jgi:hypothetical protein
MLMICANSSGNFVNNTKKGFRSRAKCEKCRTTKTVTRTMRAIKIGASSRIRNTIIATITIRAFLTTTTAVMVPTARQFFVFYLCSL